MKLIPYDIEKIPHAGRMFQNQAILKEFVESGLKCVKVDNYPHKSARSFATSFWKSARTFGYDNVVVKTKGDEVFMIRTDL